MISNKAAFNLGRYYNEVLHQNRRLADIFGGSMSNDAGPYKATLEYVQNPLTDGQIQLGISIKGLPREWGTQWQLDVAENQTQALSLIQEYEAFVIMMNGGPL